MTYENRPGAFVETGGVRFRVYSDKAREVRLRLFDAEGNVLRSVPMERTNDSLSEAPLSEAPLSEAPLSEAPLFEVFVPGITQGARYKFVLDDKEVPDPFARFLPEGVHGAAEVRSAFAPLERERRPVDLSRGEVFYELHVGTFTAEGTYSAARAKLPILAGLGVTVIELMPLSAFPGRRGWGYDGVAFFAPFAPYGAPEELREFLEEAHRLGLSVVLDVVYNHLGPDGNYLGAFSDRFFDSSKKNAWGPAPNLDDGPFVHLILDNARYWLEEVGFDGLRLDATHALEPGGSPHILERLASLARTLPGPPVLVAEDERNDPEILTRRGLDGVWADDLHHSVHVLLTGERDGYYRGYAPAVSELARTIKGGWLYDGAVWPLDGEPRGKPLGPVPRYKLFTSLQNHDQIGNRAFGERLSALVDSEAYCAATLLFLFVPSTPLLFMGQEWAASTPFLFFTDHEGSLGHAVVDGRRREFQSFSAFSDGREAERIPNPQAEQTFRNSILVWDERSREPHATVLAFYRAAIWLRRRDSVLSRSSADVEARAVRDGLLIVRRSALGEARTFVANFGSSPLELSDDDLSPRSSPPRGSSLRLSALLLTPSWQREPNERIVPPGSAGVFATNGG